MEESPLEPNNFTRDHLMKIDWLVSNVTSVGSPVSAERDIFGGNLAFLASSGRFCGRGATL